MATFCERSALSAEHTLNLYFTICNFKNFPFGFEGGIRDLIAQ